MAKHRHERETNARSPLARAALVAAPVAVLTTVSAVTLGVVVQDPQPSRDLLASTSVGDVALPERSEPVSRSNDRAERRAQKRQEAQAEAQAEARAAERRERQERQATRQAVRQADTKRWTTAALNLWTAANSQSDADKTGVLDAGERILVTGRAREGRVEIVVDGESRWVTEGYLSAEKPLQGIGGVCGNGTSVPSGVDPSITKVHQAVCARFPQVTSYGTFRSDGEHGQGRAVDIMVSGSLGWEIAEYLRANHAELGIEYLIYSQKIWSVERGGEGWRGMSNRGSATANHFDHVHVTVY